MFLHRGVSTAVIRNDYRIRATRIGRNAFFMAIEVGNKLTGKVTGITRFGAFVTLPEGATGLVHISEISDSYVKDVHDFLHVDDEVTVKVISVGNDGKIALSIRQANETAASPSAGRPNGGREYSGRGPSGGSAGSSGHSGGREYGGGGGGGRDRGSYGGGRGGSRGDRGGPRGGSFDQLMNRFLKDSEERLSALRRNESKRGGRGGRRG
jgi:S1 RNA binding domain protein